MNNEIQETRQPDNQQNEGIEQRPPRPLRTVAWIASSVALLGVVIEALFIASRYLASTSDPIQFITGNLVNGLIFVAIVAQVLIYRKQRDIMEQQWRAMRDSLAQNERAIQVAREGVGIAERTAIYANRAYVTAKIASLNEAMGHVKFRLQIENSGNTPANNVSVSYAFRLLDKPPHTEQFGLVVFDIGFTEAERLGVIAPHGGYYVIKTPTINLSPAGPDEITRWKLRELKAYCWGRIVYEDIFNDRRFTDFCFVQSDEYRAGYPCKHGNLAI